MAERHDNRFLGRCQHRTSRRLGSTGASAEQVNESWVSRLVRLNFLAPAIVEAIHCRDSASLCQRDIFTHRQPADRLERAERFVRNVINLNALYH